MTNACTIAGCYGKHVARGFCDKHYRRLVKHGSPHVVVCRRETHLGIGKSAFVLDGLGHVVLASGEMAYVDCEDVSLVSDHGWALHKDGYAHARINGRLILMHRYIMSAKAGEITDHINRNRLDNRKDNLRLCTLSQNGQNACKRTNRNRFKGAYRNRRGWWDARIRVNKKQLFLGSYPSEEDAAIVYNVAAQIFHGEFACLNNI